MNGYQFHSRRRFRSGLSALVPVLAAALSGCAGRADGVRPALLASPMGPALGAMWETAGGIDAWRRFGSVNFVYEASFGPAAFRAGAGRLEALPSNSDSRLPTSDFPLPTSGDWPR